MTTKSSTQSEMKGIMTEISAVKKKYTLDELMVISAAHEIRDGDRVVIGQGLPIVAGVLAKNTHAPRCILMTEAGIIDFAPYRVPQHIADPTCTKGFSYACDLIDSFTTILNRGYVDVAFLGAAQIDKYGNINSTAIGDYWNPKLRLMGAGGAPDFAGYAKRLIITMRGGRFVKQLDYFTSPGYLTGGDSREKAGFSSGTGPTILITTDGIFRFDKNTREIYLDSYFPTAAVEQIKEKVPWKLKVAPNLQRAPGPTPQEIEFIRTFAPEVATGKGLAMELLVKALVKFMTWKKTLKS